MTMRGVLFDSGDVLMQPLESPGRAAMKGWRRWFPGPRFTEIVRSWSYEPDLTRLDEALDHGMHYLDERHRLRVTTLAEERLMFSVFYRILLERLGIEGIPEELVWQLSVARVDGEQMEPFDDVRGGLERLRSRQLRLGVLSEAWPSLEREYERLGLRQHFDAFIISAREGRLKEDPALFELASHRMALPPDQILFVDDWSPHVQTAMACGLRGAVLARDEDRPPSDPAALTDLTGVERLLDNGAAPSDPQTRRS
jgi:putative hydrolase of the HAD superfamily